MVRPPLAVSLLMELERRGKNERVGRDERKRMVPKFKVLGQPVTSEVRSMTSAVICWHANMQSCKHHANMSYCTSFEPAHQCESFGA